MKASTVLRVLGTLCLFLGLTVGPYYLSAYLNSEDTQRLSDLIMGTAFLISGVVTGLLYLGFSVAVDKLDEIIQSHRSDQASPKSLTAPQDKDAWPTDLEGSTSQPSNPDTVKSRSRP